MTDLAPLTRAEQVALDDCEQRIERGLKTFIEVGAALSAIRDNRLYRTTHQTFEAYAVDRWNLSRAHAYRMIAAADVVSPMGDIEAPPTSERQVRELAKVPAEDRADVWAEAVERTGGKPTAKAVSDVAKERSGAVPDVVRQAVEDVTLGLKPDVVRLLTGAGAAGLTVSQLQQAWVCDVSQVALQDALFALLDAGRVMVAGHTDAGVTLWVLTELLTEDHPDGKTGEGRSAGLTSELRSDESDASVVGDVAADELPAETPALDLKAKIRADLAEIGAEGMPVGGIRLGLPQHISTGDLDAAIAELVDAGEVVCVGNTPMGATLWALSTADEPEQPARPPLLSPNEVAEIEAHAERRRAINHARRVAERFLTEVSGFVTDIEAGVLYGETGLFTEDMAAELRKQADRVERYLGERA